MNKVAPSPVDAHSAMAGKPYAWRPMPSSDMALECVAEDVRPEMQQVAHYSMLCIAMQATLDETDDVIRALQQCERVHGFNRVGPTLAVLTAAIENAVTLIPMPIQRIGRNRHLSSPGLFVGSLVEELARLPSHRRKFPTGQHRIRLHSPYVEFEDCLWGAEMAQRLHLLTEINPHAARPFGRLITAFRQQRGQDGILMVDNTARIVRDRFASANRLAPDSGSALITGFVQAIDHMAQAQGITLPALWRLYVAQTPA